MAEPAVDAADLVAAAPAGAAEPAGGEEFCVLVPGLIETDALGHS